MNTTLVFPRVTKRVQYVFSILTWLLTFSTIFSNLFLIKFKKLLFFMYFLERDRIDTLLSFPYPGLESNLENITSADPNPLTWCRWRCITLSFTPFICTRGKCARQERWWEKRNTTLRMRLRICQLPQLFRVSCLGRRLARVTTIEGSAATIHRRTMLNHRVCARTSRRTGGGDGAAVLSISLTRFPNPISVGRAGR